MQAVACDGSEFFGRTPSDNMFAFCCAAGLLWICEI